MAYANGVNLPLDGIDPEKYAIYAKILFGIVGGGGGVVWLPGSGPTPVDPEPFKVWTALPRAKRDALLGVALSELAILVDDKASRQRIRSAALALVSRSLTRLRQRERAAARRDA